MVGGKLLIHIGGVTCGYACRPWETDAKVWLKNDTADDFEKDGIWIALERGEMVRFVCLVGFSSLGSTFSFQNASFLNHRHAGTRLPISPQELKLCKSCVPLAFFFHVVYTRPCPKPRNHPNRGAGDPCVRDLPHVKQN